MKSEALEIVHAGSFNHFQFDRTDMVLLYKQPISASNLSSLSSVYLLFHFSPRLRVSYVKWNTHMTIRSLDKLNPNRLDPPKSHVRTGDAYVISQLGGKRVRRVPDIGYNKWGMVEVMVEVRVK